MKKLLILSLLSLLFIPVFSQQESNIINSNNHFSFDIYKKLKKSDKNLVFSPTSITSAVAMTYIGSKNNTLQEIRNTFYFNKNITDFSKDYKNLMFLDNKKNSVQFYYANSIWLQKGIKLNSDFSDINKKYFSSTLYQTDYIDNPEKSRIAINNWVEKSTNNKIKNLLQPLSIDNSTRLVLVNALYYKGAWKKKFNKNKNTIEDFQVGTRKFIETEYMNNAINTFYYNDKYSQIVEIPYTNLNVSLLIILPKSFKKIKKIEKNLNTDFYDMYINNRIRKRVSISIPKFNIESDFDLNKTLNDLGMKEAFTGTADFSGITNSEKLHISKVVHKANITIDEEGTEAAAATAVVMRKTSILLDEVILKINKPFIFMLRNTNTNCIYFMGKIVNPN